ncbi:MAG: RimK family alpha-L-glutamate ligase [Deltaproteobacteria bacterium]|nr:RimK family alpha-L-glutamate ligase [Deltaproteobacteria bacterium]
MQVFILSRNELLYSTRRLVEVAERRGHDVFVRDPLKFSVQVQNPPSLLYLSKSVSLPDAIIPRIGASITYFGLAVVRQFEQLGVFSLNEAHAIEASRDKLKALQILARHQVVIPRTAFIHRKKEVKQSIEEVGGVPVVIKLLEGTQGRGVLLAENPNTAEAMVELLQDANHKILVQKFIEEARGKDIRAFVIGGKVVAAMRRVSSHHLEFRSNVHRGGRAEPIDLPKEYQEAALRAAELLGLKVAGVDLLESKDGPLVIEVNSSPGLEAIERVSQVDIADEMIKFLEQEAR